MSAVQTYNGAQPPAPVENRGATILQIIERVASMPELDADKIDRLLQMQERIMDREAETAFLGAMQAAQAQMPRVTRDASNSHTRSRYAKLETINAAIGPIVTGHGFSLSFGTDTSPIADHYRITCAVSHVGGFTRHYHADIPADAGGAKGAQNKSATHAFGSTMSYGRRYLTMLIFNVALTDEDDDGDAAGGRGAPAAAGRGGDTITEQQVRELRALIAEVKADEARFLAIGGYQRLEDVRANDFIGARDMLRAKGRKSS